LAPCNKQGAGALKTTMITRKKVEKKEKRKTRRQRNLPCLLCGKWVKPEECSWEEDGSGAMYCPDCQAERESCGCSD
jgi:hypothetical protein